MGNRKMSLSDKEVQEALETMQTAEMRAAVRDYYARHREETMARTRKQSQRRFWEAMGAVVVLWAFLWYIDQ